MFLNFILFLILVGKTGNYFRTFSFLFVNLNNSEQVYRYKKVFMVAELYITGVNKTGTIEGNI